MAFETLSKDPYSDGYGFLDKYDYTSAPVASSPVKNSNTSSGGFLSGLGSLLNTAAQVAIPLIIDNNKNSIGSTQPNINPASVQAMQQAQYTQQSAAPMNWTPWIIGGSVAAGLLVLIAVMPRK